MTHGAKQVLAAAIEAGTVPGAVGLVRYRDEVVFHEAFGLAALVPEPRKMRPDTVFDLASVTKPVVGATLTLSMVDRGLISLDEEATGLLPELERLAGQGVSFRRLLSHTSGLTGWRPLYAWAQEAKDLLAVIDRLGLAAEAGSRFAYSDLGFIVLGMALQRAADQSLEQLAKGWVFDPLGMTNTRYLPDCAPDSFAITEKGNAFEKRMADWAGLEFSDWRADFYPGQVNDGNAHYGLGGVSAHAGLFSDAQDLGRFGQMWIDRSNEVLSTAVIELATVEQAPSGARRGLGWDLMKQGPPTLAELSRADAGFFPPTPSPWTPRPSGELFSARAFGHTGFTGTSIWIDPDRELVVVLLTNATHPAVDMTKPINSLRARFHNAVVATVEP